MQSGKHGRNRNGVDDGQYVDEGSGRAVRSHAAEARLLGVPPVAKKRNLRILAVFAWTVVGGLVILGAIFLQRRREDWSGSDGDSVQALSATVTPRTGFTPRHTPRDPGTSPRKETPRGQTSRAQRSPRRGSQDRTTTRNISAQPESGITGICNITSLGKPGQPKMFKVFGRDVIADDHAADYVIVLPLRTQSSGRDIHVTGAHMQVINWDEMVDGLALARSVFQPNHMNRILSAEELSQRFQQDMTREAFILNIRKLIIELLAGPHFGLKVKVTASIDNDEILMKLSLPKRNTTIQQYAANLSYKMPLSDAAYERIGSKVTEDMYGTEMRAVAEFIPEHAEYFEPFSRIDRLVLMRSRLDKFFDLDGLVKTGAFVAHFPCHNYTEVMAMLEGWANPWHWFRLPTDDAHHSVRNYFGEEIAWMFVWQSHFTRALLLPAALGAGVWYCRFVLPVTGQDKLQIVYAVFMGLWCAWFNAYYDRQENRLRHSWGMNDFTPPTSLFNRHGYKPELDRSWRVQWGPALGDFMSFVFICLSICGMHLIQQFRQMMVYRGAHWLLVSTSGILISIQIFVLDRCWRYASMFLVSLENHRSETKWHESWVRKLFPVRLFNNLYPFLYIGFFKQFTREGCPQTQDGNFEGCISELETDLITYFLLRVVAELGLDLVYLAFVRAQMLAELKKKESQGRQYTYVEVQSKALSYDQVILMDDWTEQLLTFAFVVCFNVILPAISFIALLTNLLETRLVAYRNACFLKRPLPSGAKGIGAWRQMLYFIEIIAVITNLGFAVFVLTPLKSQDLMKKGMWFLVAEHVSLLVMFFFKSNFPKMPRDIENVAERQHQDVKRTLVDLDHHPVDAEVVVEQLPDVGPRALMVRDNSFSPSGGISESDKQ